VGLIRYLFIDYFFSGKTGKIFYTPNKAAKI